MPSPPPFPLSQSPVISKDPRSESQPNGSPSSPRLKRSLQDDPSPVHSQNRLSKQRPQSSRSEKPSPSLKSSSESDVDFRRHDIDFSPMLDRPAQVPVINLRHLVSSQRSRVQSRHSSRGVNPMTPRTKDKKKVSEMTVDISPPRLSPALESRSFALASPPHRIPSLSQMNFSRDAGAFAPAATSTQPSPGKGR